MTDAYIIDAARTPRGIGKLGKGSLSEFHPRVVCSPKYLKVLNNAMTSTLPKSTTSLWAAVPKWVSRVLASAAWPHWTPAGIPLPRL